MNPQIEKIRKLVAKHRKEIADRIDVDEPAVPRRDDKGNDITGKSGKTLHDYHKERRATHRQFMKVRSESASDTQEEPEAEKPASPKAKTPRAKAKADKPVEQGKAKGKEAQIVMSPDEDQYDNNALFKNGKNTNMKEQYIVQYISWISESVKVYNNSLAGNKRLARMEFKGGANENTKQGTVEDHVSRFLNSETHGPHRKDGSYMTASAMHHDYHDWCDHHEEEPHKLTTFGRELGNHLQKAKLGGRVRYLNVKSRLTK